MLSEQLFSHYSQLLEVIQTQELPRIDRISSVIAERIAQGGALYLHDRGHLLSQELHTRAGGLTLIRSFEVHFPNVQNQFIPRNEKDGSQNDEWQADKADLEASMQLQMAAYSLAKSGIKPGDALIIGSVTGTAPFIIELAQQARKRDILVIALTAMEYTTKVTSDHPSGLRLFEVVDEVIDFHAPEGDAMLDIPGLPEKMAPASGIAAAVIGWSLKLQLTEHLLQKGITPTVFRSVSMPGGPKQVEAAKHRMDELGY